MKIEIERLFHEVADLPLDARARYFTEHHVHDETRREVEALLAFDSGASSFLLRDVGVAASRSLPQLDPKGWRCGPYRLLDVIGRGGMGAVYLAERADGEVTQRLAVKLLPPGAGDLQLERFLQERQILASLAHPNIARMLDAGHIDSNQPFLAMEYIDGQPIDVFAAGLGVRQKVSLFLKVCAAVGYLHRNLVVHRDLKPSNILVTADGEPKLLDFGIAKILDVATDSTMTSMRMLTPAYASPEQVTGGRMSTATDIYSLGAVLYQLLTGKPAHEFEDHSPEAIAHAVTARAVTRPSKWLPKLKGDLECILLKALRKDPQERFATVEQFSEDLQAFLQSRTVRARSGNAWYRTRKFLRRYWAPVSAAALVIASLAAGLYTTNRQRAVAERRFQQVRQLANQYLALDAKIQVLPGATDARRQIVSTSIGYLEALRREAGADRGLLLEIGMAYLHVARVQGVPTGSNLGDFGEADKTLAKAEEVVGAVTRADPGNRRALRASAEVAHDRMILATGGAPEAVLARIRGAMGRIEAWLAPGDATGQELTSAANLLVNVANAYTLIGLYDEAIASARRAVEILQPLQEAEAQRERGRALTRLAQVLYQKGDLELALQTVREARPLVESATYTGELQRELALHLVLVAEGRIIGDAVCLGRPGEAIEPFQKAFDMMDQLAAADPNDSISRYQEVIPGERLAALLAPREPQRALAVYDRCLLRLRETKESQNRRHNEASCLADSSGVLLRLRRLPEAKQRIDAAFALLRAAQMYPAAAIDMDRAGGVMDALRARAAYEEQTGQLQRAAESYQELLDKVMASAPQPQTNLSHAYQLSRIYGELARLYRSVSRPDSARTLEGSREELWRHWGRKLPDNPFVLRQLAAY